MDALSVSGKTHGQGLEKDKERCNRRRCGLYKMEKDDNDDTYRLGIVDSLKPGEDGLVRTATVRYTNPGGDSTTRSFSKLAVRPIHKLAVIVSAGYRSKMTWLGLVQ
jgi:hypothetical protein